MHTYNVCVCLCRAHMCVYTGMCLHTYIHMYVIYVRVYVCVCARMYVCTHVRVHACACVVCTHMCTCVCVRLYVCMHMCKYTRVFSTHTHTFDCTYMTTHVCVCMTIMLEQATPPALHRCFPSPYSHLVLC
jgi:hypothetical protein